MLKTLGPNLNEVLNEVDNAVRELADLQGKIQAARTVLARVLQDVEEAESRLGNSQAAQLVEANEQLVIAALRAQTEAVTTALALDEVSHSAHLDPLTQLPDRVLLLDRFTHAMAAARRRGTRLALLFVDLDSFKKINDTLGHAAGDEVLKRMANRLLSSVRAVDTVSRHGGDEFLILLDEVSEPHDAAQIADKLIAALGAPSPVGDQMLRLTASIGISIYPDDGHDADTLIERADAAMYLSKARGPGGFGFHCAPHAGERRSCLPLPNIATTGGR